MLYGLLEAVFKYKSILLFCSSATLLSVKLVQKLYLPEAASRHVGSCISILIRHIMHVEMSETGPKLNKDLLEAAYGFVIRLDEPWKWGHQSSLGSLRIWVEVWQKLILCLFSLKSYFNTEVSKEPWLGMTTVLHRTQNSQNSLK